ncbi:MAG: alpha-N-arabinofuranosidase [Candidatus Solibacter sp.]
MNRRSFLISSMAAAATPLSLVVSNPLVSQAAPPAGEPRVAILAVDTDRPMANIDQRIYGHFLEHINHSVEDGLFAEQIQGCGFEGEDFKTYWQPFSERGKVELVDIEFKNGKKSVRLQADGGRAGIRQGRIFVDAGQRYDGSLWIQRELGSPQLSLRIVSAKGDQIAAVPLTMAGSGWQEVFYSFTSSLRDTQASVELAVSGNGSLLLDFLSMMRADVRRDGMLRPDLLQSLRDLAPPFIRWPGGSFASTYKWKDGIGPLVSRRYHPNAMWGGYSDYYGFGTEEFMTLCRKLNSEPLIDLPAPGTEPDQIQYAMDWVHYLNDPPTTEWGKQRAANGHPEPYGVKYFQIDNEPMNNGFTAESYAAIVNAYGSRLRALVPQGRIVACGQKRSNDMVWSQKIIDLAGKNFDILGCHNYEYEDPNFETGLRRIRDYLVKLSEYVRASATPKIEIAILEWNLSRTYDWRAGLHAAGSLILYEELSPGLTMTCPALLMRNNTDDPTWTSLIYHDHVSWFPGGAYPVEKLFRQHYAEKYLGSTSGAYRDLPDRKPFFDQISTMKPEDWTQGTIDAIATKSADGRRIVIKAVNYAAGPNTLLVRLEGASAPQKAVAKLHTITASATDKATLEQPDKFNPVTKSLTYAKDLAIDLPAYTVAVVEIQAE